MASLDIVLYRFTSSGNAANFVTNNSGLDATPVLVSTADGVQGGSWVAVFPENTNQLPSGFTPRWTYDTDTGMITQFDPSLGDPTSINIIAPDGTPIFFDGKPATDFTGNNPPPGVTGRWNNLGWMVNYIYPPPIPITVQWVASQVESGFTLPGFGEGDPYCGEELLVGNPIRFVNAPETTLICQYVQTYGWRISTPDLPPGMVVNGTPSIPGTQSFGAWQYAIVFVKEFGGPPGPVPGGGTGPPSTVTGGTSASTTLTLMGWLIEGSGPNFYLAEQYDPHFVPGEYIGGYVNTVPSIGSLHFSISGISATLNDNPLTLQSVSIQVDPQGELVFFSANFIT